MAEVMHLYLLGHQRGKQRFGAIHKLKDWGGNASERKESKYDLEKRK